MDAQYEPFPYQPMMRYFYGTPHEAAVGALSAWIRKTAPAAYAAISTRRPDLLNAGSAVRSGLMGLQGMSAADAAATSTDTTAGTPITQWGSQLLDLAKGYFTYQAQRDLLNVNIARAEKGLPPIDAGALAPQVNVGISPQVQNLGYLALGGLVLVGLLAAFRR